MKQNLTRKQVIIRFFSVTGMTEQNWHNWSDFFCQGKFFEVLVFPKAVLVLTLDGLKDLKPKVLETFF